MSIGILVFDGVEELDFVGPWEVFSMAKQLGLPIEPCLISLDTKKVRCSKQLILEAEYDRTDAPNNDVYLLPGGQGTRRLVESPEILLWIAERMRSAKYQLTVCTGSVVLGKTKLLDGKRVTTHWNAFDFLADNAPNVLPVNNQRVVVDGNYYGSAGVSAGIDMSLKFIGDKFGVDAAKDVQKWMEYHPEPPFGS